MKSNLEGLRIKLKKERVHSICNMSYEDRLQESMISAQGANYSDQCCAHWPLNHQGATCHAHSYLITRKQCSKRLKGMGGQSS